MRGMEPRMGGMMFQELARHPAAVTTKAGNGSFGVTECNDVSPRSTLRVDRRGLHSFPASEQTSSGGPGPLELWDRVGPSLHPLGGCQRPQSDPEETAQHGPAAAPRMVQGLSRQDGPESPRTRCRRLFRSLVGLDPRPLAMPARRAGAGCDDAVRPFDRLVL